MGSRHRTAAWLLGLILAVSWLACASTPGADTSGSGPASKDACFNSRRVDSFSPLHASFVYVRLLGDEHYLLTLDGVYTGLPFATGIKLSGQFSRVCSDTEAMITFMDSGRPLLCRIIRVESVASKEAAQQLVKHRTPPAPKG